MAMSPLLAVRRYWKVDILGISCILRPKLTSTTWRKIAGLISQKLRHRNTQVSRSAKKGMAELLLYGNDKEWAFPFDIIQGTGAHEQRIIRRKAFVAWRIPQGTYRSTRGGP